MIDVTTAIVISAGFIVLAIAATAYLCRIDYFVKDKFDRDEDISDD